MLFTTPQMTLNPTPRELYRRIISDFSNVANIKNLNSSNDFSLLKVRKAQQDHQLTPPTIIIPNGNETLTGMVRIEWTEAIDSQGHNVSYTVSFSLYGTAHWRTIVSNIQTTYCIWDTEETAHQWGEYFIKIEAKCMFSGLTSEYTTDYKVEVQNELTPPIRFLLTLFLFALVILILVGAILYRMRFTSRIGLPANIDSLKNAKIGLCFGSFTDEGLIIKCKNDNCPFSLQYIQSMLEYSAVLYQHGKAETMYGPIPLSSLVEVEQPTEPLQNEWNFISYWLNVKDSTVKDLRITRIGGIVQAAILFFYPNLMDHLVIVKKNNINDIFKSVIDNNTNISDFTKDILNQIEKQLFKLVIS
jgi:hypothetical protein